MFQVIDLFCGFGGFSYGLKLSGMLTIAGFDVNPNCAFPYMENTKGRFYNIDINKLSGEDLYNLYDKNSIKVLVGSPPCQPFSTYTKNSKKDERRSLVIKFANIALQSNVDIVLMENVPSIKYSNEFIVLHNLLYNNYHIDYKVIDFSQWGLPQKRKRLIFIAAKKELFITIKNTNIKTVKSAIGSLPPLKAGEQDANDKLHICSRLSPINMERIKHSKPGGSWKDWPEYLILECHKSCSSYTSVYGRMEWHKPSPTLTTNFMGYGNGRFGHPEQDRALSLREGALLQGFDYNFKFYKDKLQIRNIAVGIGNAIPPSISKKLGEFIISNYL